MNPRGNTIWQHLNRPFWLYKREVFPATEVSGLEPSRRVVFTVRYPGILLAAVMLIFAYAYYLALSVPLVWLTSTKLTIVHWPAVSILAFNSTFRFVLKSKERTARLAGWEWPVGRRDRNVLIQSVMIGVLAGYISAWWADKLVSAAHGVTAPVFFLLMVSAAEGYLNSARIGGGAAYDHIKSPPLEIWETEL